LHQGQEQIDDSLMVRHFGKEEHALTVEREAATRFAALRGPCTTEIRRGITQAGIRPDVAHDGTATSAQHRSNDTDIVR